MSKRNKTWGDDARQEGVTPGKNWLVIGLHTDGEETLISGYKGYNTALEAATSIYGNDCKVTSRRGKTTTFTKSLKKLNYKFTVKEMSDTEYDSWVLDVSWRSLSANMRVIIAAVLSCKPTLKAVTQKIRTASPLIRAAVEVMIYADDRGSGIDWPEDLTVYDTQPDLSENEDLTRFFIDQPDPPKDENLTA